MHSLDGVAVGAAKTVMLFREARGTCRDGRVPQSSGEEATEHGTFIDGRSYELRDGQGVSSLIKANRAVLKLAKQLNRVAVKLRLSAN